MIAATLAALAMTASPLQCTAKIDGLPGLIRHTLSFPSRTRMVDTMPTRLGAVGTPYRLRVADSSGINADTQLSSDTTSVILVDRDGTFTQIANVNGTIRYANGVCR